MPDRELVQTLDYILNRCSEASLEAVSEAVARKWKEYNKSGEIQGMPDPQKLAKEISEKINSGIGSTMSGLKETIRQMIVNLIREKAPELSDEQIEELSRAWVSPSQGNEGGKPIPRDVLISMIEQFVSFSQGTMNKSIDNNLRKEVGAWPERYWDAFPAVIRNIITDYLKGRITNSEFYSKIGIALEL